MCQLSLDQESRSQESIATLRVEVEVEVEVEGDPSTSSTNRYYKITLSVVEGACIAQLIVNCRSYLVSFAMFLSDQSIVHLRRETNASSEDPVCCDWL